MALEAYSLCRPSESTGGKIPLETYYTGADITFSFPYEGFEWLPLLPAPWIYGLVGILALAGVTLAFGFWYRTSATAVFLSWAYLYAVESTRTYWMSYYYLELLITFLLIWMPAARRYSIDAWLARRRNPPRTVPNWTVLLLRGQLVIAYFYAGVAKLNADWLLDAEPVRYYLSQAHVTAPYELYLTAAQLGFVKAILHGNAFVYFVSWAGAFFDLAVGFMLLIRRTRIFALVLLVLFHATNHFLIFDDIGWFPLLGVATALIFLDADWPERFRRWLRRPRLARPDWRWFATGGILFPFVGASLGWKLKAGSPLPEEAKERHHVGRCVAAFVVVWLVWQMLLPTRHYLIPGDGRFTWEGLSFSWRLKAEIYRSSPCQITAQDAVIISRDDTGQTRINWNEWHGDKVIYRKVTPGRINWSLLPEVVVLLEPLTGERLIYNPFAGSNFGRTEAESRERVARIWQEVYGRPPQAVRRIVPLSEILDAYATALRAKGGPSPKNYSDLLAVLDKHHGREGNRMMIPFLRLVNPFALEGAPPIAASFLLIEDKHLLQEARIGSARVNRTLWINGPYTRPQRNPPHVHVGGEPLVIYTSDVGLDAREMLPQASIYDFQDHPERPAQISWNYLTELSNSKGMHISYQPFYLRRYARRVASLWEKEYGRRPTVRASTAVSLNRRPSQLLVDPDADLTSVSVAWFGHNRWIRDLEWPRIPREAPAKGLSN